MTRADRRDQAVATLLDAESDRSAIEPLTDAWPDLDLDTAYDIQDRALDERLARGETLVGAKIGLTSRAKQERMGVSVPLTGWLTDAMSVPLGSSVPQDRMIHPRAEPEIVFVMGEPLEGPGMTAARALSAVAAVHAGVELIDSRFRDFRFQLPDVVADNASSAGFIIGPVGLEPTRLDLSLEACIAELDGAVVDSATGAAVLGHPAEALALAANILAERGHRIEAGWVVLTGGMTDAIAVPLGQGLIYSFTNLGSIAVSGGRTSADR